MKLRKNAVIKVIKRNSVGQEPTKQTSMDLEHSDAKSEIKKTVTAWVHQFQRRRRLEPHRAFRSLFEE